MSLLTGLDTLKTQMVMRGNDITRRAAEKDTVEGTMIAVDNDTGYINTIVGGSRYDESNQFIRATQAKIQPGSSFKPLYYSAAIDTKTVTMTTVLSDTTAVFIKADGEPYFPKNYGGHYRGNVEVWQALCLSLNIPALQVLEKAGFDAAIVRATDLLGIPENEWEERSIAPLYALGLGVCSVRPIEMAKAYATIANGGKEVTPIAIRYIEDKNGNIMLNPERELKDREASNGGPKQVISPQNAFIMQELLKMTVSRGTLASGSNYSSTMKTIQKDKGKGYKFRFTDETGKSFNMPVAGKTGTTQNWADAWAVGFTPYVTSVFWFGFDRPGQSLGLSITGASLAGPAWGDFMHIANENKPYKPFFTNVPRGLVRKSVCSKYGGVYTKECGNDIIVAYYYAGTEPTEPCTKHGADSSLEIGADNLEKAAQSAGWGFDNDTDAPLELDLDFLDEDNNSNSNWFTDLFGGGSESKKKDKQKDNEISNDSDTSDDSEEEAPPKPVEIYPPQDDDTNWLLQ
ncbi:MAG: penicillin-binding protein, partial [Treponema sp.]|nr:penicillin-binding protein [Treponema sp.]